MHNLGRCHKPCIHQLFQAHALHEDLMDLDTSNDPALFVQVIYSAYAAGINMWLSIAIYSTLFN